MSSYSIDLFGRNSGIIYVQLVSREGFISYLRLGSQNSEVGPNQGGKGFYVLLGLQFFLFH